MRAPDRSKSRGSAIAAAGRPSLACRSKDRSAPGLRFQAAPPLGPPSLQADGGSESAEASDATQETGQRFERLRRISRRWSIEVSSEGLECAARWACCQRGAGRQHRHGCSFSSQKHHGSASARLIGAAGSDAAAQKMGRAVKELIRCSSRGKQGIVPKNNQLLERLQLWGR